MIRGTVRDIQPCLTNPTLELTFEQADTDSFVCGTKVPVRLHLHGATWIGTVANPGTRRPYVHTALRNAEGSKASCTDVFLALGLATGAVLEFRRLDIGELELVRIADPGAWLEGRSPHERSAASAGEHRVSPPVSAPHTPQSIRVTAPTDAALRAFPSDDRLEILRLADLYWTLISPGEAAEERKFENEMAAVRLRGFLDKPLFMRMARWKSVRPTKHYLSNSALAVETATAGAIAATDDRAALLSLTALNGVALRTATALLHWLRPDRYPILDYRVVSALGESAPASYEDPAFYAFISDRVRRIATQHALDLRTVDRAMWSWDKLRTKGQ